MRLDTTLYAGYTIPGNYDSMIGKLIIWSLDWEGAVKKARRALDEFFIDGVVTNIPLHREITRDLDFTEGRFDTGYLDQKLPLFNLDAIDHMKVEDKRMTDISALIETIRNNNITTRH